MNDRQAAVATAPVVENADVVTEVPLVRTMTAMLTPLQRAAQARKSYQAAAAALVDASDEYRLAVQEYMRSAKARGLSQRKAASALGITESALRDLLADARRPR